LDFLRDEKTWDIISARSGEPRAKRGKNASVLGNIRRAYANRGIRQRKTDVPVVSLRGAKRCPVAIHRHGEDGDPSGAVQFATLAEAIEIPHFSQYSREQKDQMWNDRQAIRLLAKKNTVEYEWEGWDWKTAVEEDQFIRLGGHLVHPVWEPQGRDDCCDVKRWAASELQPLTKALCFDLGVVATE
jgi:hypothetical protein